MGNRVRAASAVLSLFMLAGLATPASGLELVTIGGTVTDANGGPVVNARVMSDELFENRRSTCTAADGSYSLDVPDNPGRVISVWIKPVPESSFHGFDCSELTTGDVGSIPMWSESETFTPKDGDDFSFIVRAVTTTRIEVVDVDGLPFLGAVVGDGRAANRGGSSSLAVGSWTPTGVRREFGDNNLSGDVDLDGFIEISTTGEGQSRQISVPGYPSAATTFVELSGPEVQAVLPLTQSVPSAPGTPLLGRSGNSVVVDWSAAQTADFSPITQYVVESTPAGFSCEWTRTSRTTSPPTSCTISGLTPGVEFRFSVTAINAAGAGPTSPPSASVSIPEPDPPDPTPEPEPEPTVDPRQTAFDELAARPDLNASHANILRLYWAAFDRIPDLGGAQWWIDAYNTGAWPTLVRIAEHFAVSAEFIETYGQTSNAGFVDALYLNILDRPGEPGGRTFWISELDAGRRTRGQVLADFSYSPEFRANHPLPSDNR